MNAGELLSLRNNIDIRLNEMAAELEKQLVQIQDITGTGKRRGRRSLAGTKAEAKYRNPANHEETWAGRGMKPKWLTAALKGGKKLESFEIKK